jgi:hypothetical protein
MSVRVHGSWGDSTSSLESAEARLKAFGPRFVPPALPAQERTSPELHPAPQVLLTSGSCVVPLGGLAVRVLPATASRLYGGANPTFTYSVKGLENGDTVSVQ